MKGTTMKALIVDDDPEIIEVAGECLDSLLHAYDSAQDQQTARRLVEKNNYDYVLLDLEIPNRPGGINRPENGKNLLVEIVEQRGRTLPVIVISSHGLDGPAMAVDVMKKGAVDFVPKPFPTTLDLAIEEALGSFGKPKVRRRIQRSKLAPFNGGELAFLPGGAELCGVRIISDRGIGWSLRSLNELANQDAAGNFVRKSAEELVDAIGADGVGTITSSVQMLRRNARDRLAKHVSCDCGLDDLIGHDEQGYFLQSWITVRFGANGPTVTATCTAERTSQPSWNERQLWVLDEVRFGTRVRRLMIEKRLGVTDKTAKRDLAQLRKAGEIEYVGSGSTGYYQQIMSKSA